MNNEFLLELTSTLQQTGRRKQLNSDTKQLSSQLSTIKLKGKIDSRNLKTKVDKALSNNSKRVVFFVCEKEELFNG